MRRLALCLGLLLLAPPASAAGPQVTDPAGDANGTGTVAPAPGSLPEFDITAVRWWADGATQRVSLTLSAAPGDGRYVLSWATPSCATQRLEWQPGWEDAYLTGCKPRHRRWPDAPVVKGTTLTFAIPRRDLPTWLAPGTVLTSLAATAAPVVDLALGQLNPAVDTANSDARYVVGS